MAGGSLPASRDVLNMFHSKKKDDADAKSPRRSRRRVDPELIPYMIGFVVFCLVIAVYTTSVGEADKDGNAVDKIERAFMKSIDSVETEIYDITKKLAEGGGALITGHNAQSYETLISAINDSNDKVATLISDINSRLSHIEESFIAQHEADHEHLHEHLHTFDDKLETNIGIESASARPSGSAGGGKLEDGVHFVLTSNGNMYSNWQTRFCYYSYKRVAGHKDSVLKKFTRILHRSVDDELMEEIPTFRVYPTQPECEGWCDFPVNDRPKAVHDWLLHENASGGVQYKYIMMGEPDYVFVKPITSFHIPPPGEATAFRYGYINPDYPHPSKAGNPPVIDITTRIYNNATLTEKLDERFRNANTDITKVPGTGPCPVVIDRDNLLMITPLWDEYTKAIEADKDAKDSFGWVREMYGYSLAAGKLGIKHNMLTVPEGNMMAQVRAPAPGQTHPFCGGWGGL